MLYNVSNKRQKISNLYNECNYLGNPASCYFSSILAVDYSKNNICEA